MARLRTGIEAMVLVKCGSRSLFGAEKCAAEGVMVARLIYRNFLTSIISSEPSSPSLLHATRMYQQIIHPALTDPVKYTRHPKSL
jgi:hypothetical protein